MYCIFCNVVVEKSAKTGCRLTFNIWFCVAPAHRAGIFNESMGARNRGGIDRPARLFRLAEFIPWNRFPGFINV